MEVGTPDARVVPSLKVDLRGELPGTIPLRAIVSAGIALLQCRMSNMVRESLRAAFTFGPEIGALGGGTPLVNEQGNKTIGAWMRRTYR